MCKSKFWNHKNVLKINKCNNFLILKKEVVQMQTKTKYVVFQLKMKCVNSILNLPILKNINRTIKQLFKQFLQKLQFVI